ncbi:MAG: excinuclease ABC subunit A [Acidobacteria bacterium]|nr:MAG: excinuclease ABC subunit A [Acidobacteriota bacterium]
MIRSFRCKHTEALFAGEKPKRFSAFARVAQRKLRQLAADHELADLSVFPGNHLEALKGDREGQHSIRVNDQFRICFVWGEGETYDVEIVDYH